MPWGAGAIGNAVWTGVRLADLLAAAGASDAARHVAFTGLDRPVAEGTAQPFAASIPMAKALSPEVVVAYEMDGEPLAPEHGFPVRVVVPGYIGARSVKWLAGISVRASQSPSFFQLRDYALDGTPLTDWFPVAGAEFPEFQFLMDGSLVLRFGRDSDFKYRFEDGKAAISPMPTWLQQRSLNQLFVVRGGKGYASWGTQGPCPGKLEVLSASSGKSCGCLAVPSLLRTASIGRDGSLIAPPQGSCQYNLYPQLLQ